MLSPETYHWQVRRNGATYQMTQEYRAEFRFGSVTVVLAEQAVIDDERDVMMYVNEVQKGRLTFLRYYRVQYFVDNQFLAVWAGVRMYLTDSENWTVRKIERADEVHNVFSLAPPLRGLWCIQGETSLSLFDPVLGMDRKSLLHDEIILESSLSGNIVHFSDFVGRRYAIDLTQL